MLEDEAECMQEINAKHNLTQLTTNSKKSKKQVSEGQNMDCEWNLIKKEWIVRKCPGEEGDHRGFMRCGSTWNEDAVKAIEEKRQCYKIWCKTKAVSSSKRGNKADCAI